MGWGSADGVGPLEKFSPGQPFTDCVKVGISVSFSVVSLTSLPIIMWMAKSAQDSCINQQQYNLTGSCLDLILRV